MYCVGRLDIESTGLIILTNDGELTNQLKAVAEESGRLDVELVRVAVVTESDLDRNLKTAVAFAEPLMLFLIAGFIGIIFIGMLLPVLTMSDYIK